MYKTLHFIPLTNWIIYTYTHIIYRLQDILITIIKLYLIQQNKEEERKSEGYKDTYRENEI